jgi:hypothetical protein
MEQDKLGPYERLIGAVWDRMVRVLGVHTVMVVAQRALWMARLEYDQAALIDVQETGFCFDRVTQQCPDKSGVLAEELLMSLTDVVTKLVGLDMSRRIAADIDEVIKP